MKKEKLSIFWFRRDFRLEDNHALYKALNAKHPVLCLFIFDSDIIDELDQEDARLSFIHNELNKINSKLTKHSSSIFNKKGKPEIVWTNLIQEFDIQEVYANEDYEPYAIYRDKKIGDLLKKKGINFNLLKDQVIYAKGEILKGDQTPYTIYTPYKNKWLAQFENDNIPDYSPSNFSNLIKCDFKILTLKEMGFVESAIKVQDFSLKNMDVYEEVRDFPALNQTSYLSPHLRFGTVSIRKIVKAAQSHAVFLSELIWREFFMQILYHFPDAVKYNFKRKYDPIQWRNDPTDFEKWKKGETGYPMVDAGMRELNATGYMHNRVRMVVASFLCKHLLIDWRWGEAYFAEKLLDYELSSNNGNWQWAAGTGCDASPYFRVFNPSSQLQKFDKKGTYIKKWIPEYDSLEYPLPMVDHKMGRERAINTYKLALAESSK